MTLKSYISILAAVAFLASCKTVRSVTNKDKTGRILKKPIGYN
ncbi:MAG: hypothetical protein FD136_1497 [Chitinophagaceae bacterium]|nr:MAG: hypothetical protein FD136_1497 [Chitinophagaceae bacterium]